MARLLCLILMLVLLAVPGQRSDGIAPTEGLTLAMVDVAAPAPSDPNPDGHAGLAFDAPRAPAPRAGQRAPMAPVPPAPAHRPAPPKSRSPPVPMSHSA